MWNNELAVVAQRYSDQCPGHHHDLERSKLDGTPVGQNIGGGSGVAMPMTKDEAMDGTEGHVSHSQSNVVMEVFDPKTGESHNTTDIPADIPVPKDMVKDEAGVQADVVEAGKFWYNEVSNPGGEQGHYTQLVWADTEELGCGLTHFKVKQQRILRIFI